MHRKYFSLFVLFIVIQFLFIEYINAQSDTIKTHQLSKVEITTAPSSFSNRTTSPQHIVTKAKLEKTNAFQASDALKFLSGVQVKDYGGIGGLKTVSVRNMGANYTTVAYDGIPITNYMTGQIDLGRFSLNNIEMLKLNIGENDDIFQPARLQALGGSVNLITLSPYLASDKKSKGIISFKAGSWGLFNPSLTYKVALSNTWTLDASTEYLRSDGEYPYKQTYGYGLATDPIIKKKRVNSDVENWKIETNLSGKFQNEGDLRFKIYYFDSKRGIPGYSSYYDIENTGERVKDKNVFTQISYQQPLNTKWKFQTNAKFDLSHTNYKNLKWQKKNKYEQEEYYLNTSFLYQLSENLSFSLSNDITHGTFNSDTINNKYRTSWLSSFSGKYQTSQITVTGSLLNHLTHNSVNYVSKRNTNHLSPYLGLSVRPFKNRSLRIRTFYKNSYRFPTFGDIYYSEVQNSKLKPENAHQYNVGVTVSRSSGILFSYFAFSIDTYYNNIENKIVIEPHQSQFHLSTKNHGEVDIKGIDLNLEFHVNISKTITAEISGSYTYQQVEDKKEGQTLILAYTPKHSGSGCFSLKTNWANFNYNFIRSGKRYYKQIEEPEFMMKPYSDHNLSISKGLNWNKYKIQLTAECLNIFNKQYEIICSYPMPGRSFRFGINIHF
ncbi:TonB-dependent receptor plug domain-containing protein [Bacteroidales bacterium OttesenSCG-928-M06]|nr:TonB-dependent receptor plug domain-containing protein [Bacteroidales bacterium OttesenSCG-928-M06]